MSVSRLVLPVLFLVACGGSGASVDGLSPAADTPPPPSGAGSGSGSGGPGLALHLRATAAPFPHADDLSGLTPAAPRLGIVSLTLLRTASDLSPWVVFDRGTSFVDASLDDGADTAIATVPRADLVPGTFTRARVGVTHVSYEVPSRMHAAGLVTPGVFRNVQVLADGTVLDGVTRPSGWYRYSFLVGGAPAGTVEGANAPLPSAPSAPFVLRVEGGRAFYDVPVLVVIGPDRDAPAKAIFTVNVHEHFRWRDEAQPGYAKGAFDTTPASFEPVIRFGANAFELTVE